jgi:hypothetical protein
VLLIFFCFATFFYAPKSVNSASTELRFGINFQSTNYHYNEYLTDDVLDRDFSFFENQGLDFIILNVIWKYFEEEGIGAYREEAIGNLTRICEIAEKHGLKVIFDFHTIVNKDSSWTIPEWVAPTYFETVFTNSTVREAWLNFVGHMANRLQDVDNIESWQMMNEPAIGSWACNVSVDDFINLWTDMKNRIRLFSDKPVSIRFSAATFYHFNYNPRIYDVCDYFSINWYIQDDPSSEGNFTAAVLDAQEHGCNVMVSEFGVDSGDQGELVDSGGVTELYLASLELFRSIGVNECAAWFWRADYYLGNPSPPGTGYNLAIDVNGTPRDAFYLLNNEPLPTRTDTSAPSPSPTPTPTLIPTPTPTAATSPSPTLTPSLEPTSTPPSTISSELLIIVLIGGLTGFGLTFLFFKKRKDRSVVKDNLKKAMVIG